MDRQRFTRIAHGQLPVWNPVGVAHPSDTDAEAMLQRIRPWRDAYLRWGRETLGFGLYLFRSPAAIGIMEA